MNAATIAAPALLPWGNLDIPTRMLAVMSRVRLIGGEERVTSDDFHRAPETCDLSQAELDANIGKASILLVKGQSAEAAYDREARIIRGAALVLGLMPDAGAVHATLRDAGFTTREVGELWPEIISRAADRFDADRAPKPTIWARDVLEKDAR